MLNILNIMEPLLGQIILSNLSILVELLLIQKILSSMCMITAKSWETDGVSHCTRMELERFLSYAKYCELSI